MVTVRGHEVSLTPREYEIMQLLAKHPGWVFSAEQLATQDSDADYSPDSVSVLVSRLRQKLARAGELDAIETVRGVGYRLRVPPLDAAEVGDGDASSDPIRDAMWRLQETALDVERTGTPEERVAAVEALEAVRRAIESAREQ